MIRYFVRFNKNATNATNATKTYFDIAKVVCLETATIKQTIYCISAISYFRTGKGVVTFLALIQSFCKHFEVGLE